MSQFHTNISYDLMDNCGTNCVQENSIRLGQPIRGVAKSLKDGMWANKVELLECSNKSQFIAECVESVYSTLKTILESNPNAKPVLALSGGTTPKEVYQTLSRLCMYTPLDWKRVKMLMIDERYIAVTDANSNYAMIKESLQLNDNQLSHPNTDLPIDLCVSDYEEQLLNVIGGHNIDIAILGMGLDGHIASWFPPMIQQIYLDNFNSNKLVYKTYNPNVIIPDRITISMKLICRANRKFLFIRGKDKLQVYRNLVTSNKLLSEEPLLQVLSSSGVTVISEPPLSSLNRIKSIPQEHITILIFGASGDLAKKKILPALFCLLCDGLLPCSVNILGYGRTPLSHEEYWDQHVLPSITKMSQHYASRKSVFTSGCFTFINTFKSIIKYIQGDYDIKINKENNKIVMTELYEELVTIENDKMVLYNRLVYVALPPEMCTPTIEAMQQIYSPNGWLRVVVEKPFGFDLASARQMSVHLKTLLEEQQIFRIDHYLGKDMVLNLLSLRFTNFLFSHTWCSNYITSVHITFMETLGIGHRGRFFDQAGIVRDIMQNHLIQLLALIGMERPVTMQDEDIRDEKVKVLRHVKKIDINDCIIGQYGESELGNSYIDEEYIPKTSNTPTYCSLKLYIENDRWKNIPFYLTAGKALDKNLVEITIKYKNVPSLTFNEEIPPNELVIQIQPVEQVYLKIHSNRPGRIDVQKLEACNLNLGLRDEFNIERMPDAYERLLYEVIQGNSSNFVRTDELEEAWKIFTPLLQELADTKPFIYPRGTECSIVS